METTITQVSPVEYELEIRAGKEVLEPRIDKALQERRKYVNLKGFRPGRVPISVVRKLHGRAVSYEVVDSLIQETFRNSVLEAPDHDVLGSPTITKLEYEPHGDLQASVQFGVRPKFELEDLSGAKMIRMTHSVTDAEVDEELARARASRATFEPREEPAEEEDFVRVDLQRLDPATDTAIIGERQEGVTFFLGGELDEDAKRVLIGTTKGDTVRFSLAKPDSTERNRYQADVTEVQRRNLPELNDDLVSEITDSALDSVQAFREHVTERLQKQWDQLLQDRAENEAIRKLVDMHTFDIPHSVIHVYLDSMIEDIKRRNNGTLPNGFDEHAFHHEHHEEAEEMARWMLIRDKIVSENEIGVEDADLDEAFSEMGGRSEESGESVRKMFEKHYPDMIEQMTRRVEHRKVFDWIFSQFDVKTEEWTDDREAPIEPS